MATARTPIRAEGTRAPGDPDPRCVRKPGCGATQRWGTGPGVEWWLCPVCGEWARWVLVADEEMTLPGMDTA